MTRVSLFILMIFLSSCSNNTVFSKYKAVDNNKWQKDSIFNFDIKIQDTLNQHAIYLNLRNDKDYQFNNIFLIVDVDFPNNTKITDTLEYKMTNDKGMFLGTGFTDVKENKLELKESIIFPTKGVYKFQVQQAMRKNGKEKGVEFLNGITDVGIQIEKLKN